MKEKILYTTLGIILYISIIFGVLIWTCMMYVGIKEYYDLNPNSRFITIPTVIFGHIFGYICFTRK